MISPRALAASRQHRESETRARSQPAIYVSFGFSKLPANHLEREREREVLLFFPLFFPHLRPHPLPPARRTEHTRHRSAAVPALYRCNFPLFTSASIYVFSNRTSFFCANKCTCIHLTYLCLPISSNYLSISILIPLYVIQARFC